jgi:hypothetical protein
MVIITFPDGAEWFKPNWVFRRIVESVANNVPADDQVQNVMRKAEAFGHLALDSLAPSLAARVTHALTVVVNEASTGNLIGPNGERSHEEPEHAMYLQSIRELSALICGRRSI